MHIQYLTYLQAKLVKYKNEALEGGELVEQLTVQARSDQHTIRELQGKLEEERHQLQTIKVTFNFISHFIGSRRNIYSFLKL
jgi:hypothetical protein